MSEIDFMSSIHTSTSRDYLKRVKDPDFPKAKAAELAKQWDFDYWDGDRRVNYGGYKYIPGRWATVAKALIEHYGLTDNSRILDVGCGKGFQLKELQTILPGIEVTGLDISKYAIRNGHPDLVGRLLEGSATHLPFPDKSFDLVYSINTLHNLYNFDLNLALREIERVGVKKYICVESYRDESEKANLLYWQVTCEAFCSPDEWRWWFDLTGYTGDYSFIYFS